MSTIRMGDRKSQIEERGPTVTELTALLDSAADSLILVTRDGAIRYESRGVHGAPAPLPRSVGSRHGRRKQAGSGPRAPVVCPGSRVSRAGVS